MDALPPDIPGSDLIGLWLALVVAVVVAGLGVAAGALAYFTPDEIGPWLPVAVGVGGALLIATPVAAAWASMRPDWDVAGLRAVGVGLLSVAVALPVVTLAARLAGLDVTGQAVPIAATAGLGGAVAAALRPTSLFSMRARALAVAAVLLLPVGVFATGEVLGPHPAAAARSLWLAAPLAVIPLVGLADLAAHAIAAALRRS